MINLKNKNNVILMISALLIVIAVIITCVATAVEHGKTKEAEKTDTSSTSAATTSSVPETSEKTVADNGAGTYIVNTQSTPLNLRDVPDGNSIYEIPKGAKITVQAVYGDWGYVSYEGVGGWVAMKYIKLATPSTEVAEYKTGKYTIATQSDPLGIRSKPEDDAEWLHGVPKGTEVEILAVVGEWGYVEYKGTEGWLNFQYLK